MRLFVVCASLILSQLWVVAPATAAAPTYADPIVETSRLSNGDVRVRIVVPSVPSGVKAYRFYDRDSNKLRKTCSAASMRNGSGADGCYLTRKSTVNQNWVVRAVGTNNALGPVTYIPIKRLDADQGTTQVIWVRGDIKGAAATFKAVARVFRTQATGCAQDAAVKQALKSLKSLSTKAARRAKNPYVAAGALLAHGVAYYDKAAGFKNRCAAITGLVKNMASAIKRARENKKPAFVYATTWWVRPTGPDFCSVYSSGNSTKSRPPYARGLNESGCNHFWGSMVS